MKTYLLNSIQNLASISRNLDAKAILYSKTWEVFNDSGDKEVFIFRTKNELLISRKGNVQKGKWELLSTSSILIDVDEKSYLLNAAFVDSQIMALKLDGTDECMILLDSQFKLQLMLNTIDAITKYFETIAPQQIEFVTEEILHEKAVQKDNDEITNLIIIAFAIIIVLVIVIKLINALAN